MIIRPIKKIWTHLLIAFDENYTLEGFEKTRKNFELPENFRELGVSLKRKLTICNLFANQHQSIPTIARVLDVGIGLTISTLIEHGLIKDRRMRKPKRVKQEKRQEACGLNIEKFGQPSSDPAQIRN